MAALVDVVVVKGEVVLVVVVVVVVVMVVVAVVLVVEPRGTPKSSLRRAARARVPQAGCQGGTVETASKLTRSALAREFACNPCKPLRKPYKPVCNLLRKLCKLSILNSKK